MVCQWDRNPEISLSSRNNPEMSQCSSDLPMLVNFLYIYFLEIFSELGAIIHGVLETKNWYFIDIHCNQNSLKNRNCQNQLMFLQGVHVEPYATLVARSIQSIGFLFKLELDFQANDEFLCVARNLVQILSIAYGNCFTLNTPPVTEI